MKYINIDNLIHIFDYINTTSLKINYTMTLDEILELMWEVQNIKKRQQIYFTELKCKCILRDLKLQKKNNYIQQYYYAVFYDYNYSEYGNYEYLYYD